MVLLTLLIVVHEYLASHIITYYRLKFDTAVASERLIEILSEDKREFEWPAHSILSQ